MKVNEELVAWAKTATYTKSVEQTRLPPLFKCVYSTGKYDVYFETELPYKDLPDTVNSINDIIALSKNKGVMISPAIKGIDNNSE
jgi:hypothetical protein